MVSAFYGHAVFFKQANDGPGKSGVRLVPCRRVNVTGFEVESKECRHSKPRGCVRGVLRGVDGTNTGTRWQIFQCGFAPVARMVPDREGEPGEK